MRLELSEQGFKNNYGKHAKGPMDKLNSIQEEMSNVSLKMEIIRIKKKGYMLKKKTVTELKNSFDRLISRLDTI